MAEDSDEGRCPSPDEARLTKALKKRDTDAQMIFARHTTRQPQRNKMGSHRITHTVVTPNVDGCEEHERSGPKYHEGDMVRYYSQTLKRTMFGQVAQAHAHQEGKANPQVVWNYEVTYITSDGEEKTIGFPFLSLLPSLLV